MTTAEKINAGFVAGLAIVVLIGVVSYRTMTRSITNSAAVAETHEVLASLQRVQSLLLDAESSQRAYIISGDRDYLARFESAHEHISGELVRLRELRFADTDGIGRLSQLGTLIAQRIATIREEIRVYDASGRDAADAAVIADQGRAVMDTIRALAGSLERRERALLQNRLDRADLSARGARAVVVGSALFGFLLVFLSTHLIRRDIMERQRVENALRESEAVLGQFMESLPVGVYVIDAAGRPRFANTAARALLGRGIVPEASPEEMNQTYQIYRARTESLYPASELPLVQALAGFRSTIEDAEVHRNGRVVPVAISAAPIYDVTGRVAYAIAVFSDITEQRRSEERVNAEVERLGRTRFQGDLATKMLCRPGVDYGDVVAVMGVATEPLSAEEVGRVETLIRYEAYIERSRKHLAGRAAYEKMRLDDVDYGSVPGLSIEGAQALTRAEPVSLGAAQRVRGVRDSDVTALLVHLKTRRGDRGIAMEDRRAEEPGSGARA